MGVNIAQVVHQWSLRDPERIAVVLADEPGHTLSYGELGARAARAAAHLLSQGVGAGDHVAICAENGVAFLDAFFGALYAGCTVLPIPPMSAAPELAYRLQHARCRALITDAHTLALGEQALTLAPGARRLDAEALSSHATASDGPADLPAESAAMVLYTSGTTGVAKGAVITHASLLTHTAALVHHTLRLSAEDVVMATLPLTHSYGIRMTLFAPFYAGARSVLVRRFNTARVHALLHREGVTWMPGVPTMFHAMLHEPLEAEPKVEGLRWCLSAGAPLPRDVQQRFEARLGVPLRQGFGLTEATFSTIATPEDHGAIDSVGRPVFGVEVRIQDEHGRPVPAGQTGEICVRGQNVMAGYLHDPEATAQAMRAGFLRSGDIGMLDSEGRLYVIDRLKDMIIRGGFNVYPAEVEATLVAHPSVREAVVVGVPDEKYGEEVAAVITLCEGHTLDVTALDVYCRAHLSRTKLPRLFAALPSLPVGPSGKLLRRAVRALALEGKLELVRVGS